MAVIGGAHYIIAKNVVPTFVGASGMIVIRVFCGTIFFIWLDLFHKNQSPIEKKDYWKIVACALTGVTINQLMFFNGLAITSPINASLIMMTSPIMVSFFAVYLLKEKIKWYNAVGIFIGICGAIMLIINKNKVNDFQGNATGDLYILINATAWSSYLIFAAPLMQQYNPFKLLKWTFGLGFLFVLPFGYNQFVSINMELFTMETWFGLSYIILLGTMLAYYINTAVLKHVSASITGIYIYFQPLVATIIAVLIGVDSLNLYKIIAAIMIFTGVYLVSKKTY
jgi:drug/metabolite transporter (DMT)-like permease